MGPIQNPKPTQPKVWKAWPLGQNFTWQKQWSTPAPYGKKHTRRGSGANRSIEKQMKILADKRERSNRNREARGILRPGTEVVEIEDVPAPPVVVGEQVPQY